MIILTAEEAVKVRGRSPSDGHAALEPIPLKDGSFMLPEHVLADPAHADVHEFLNGCAKGDVPVQQRYVTDADMVELSAKGLPTYRDAGKRSPEAKKR